MRLLIVDDEPAICDTLQDMLEREGFAIDTATDGSAGAHLALSNEYDLIVLDCRLPNKNGDNIVRDVREAGRTTPILILSAMFDAHHKATLLDAGADDYLQKPFSYVELLARIRAILRRQPNIIDATLVAGNLALDTKRHIVRCGTDELTLTRKEFALLEYLMRHAGTTLSRGTLIEHVWDMDVDPFSNTVESHIASLRKKLEESGMPRLIRTITGCGYKFDAKLDEY